MDDAASRSSKLHGDVKVRSAGTFAAEDMGATPEAVRAMEEIGLSLKRHESEQFSTEHAEWADVMLAMGREQMEHMEVIAPEQTEKMHTLLGYVAGVMGEPVNDDFDICDPYDEGMDEYRTCAAQLKDAVDTLVALLEKDYEN